MAAKKKSGSDRAFGLLFALIFGGLGAWPLMKGAAPQPILLALGGLFLALALVAPRTLGPLNRLWLAFGDLLHRIVNPLLMAVMFFLVFTPIGLLMRLLGKDGLHRKYDHNAASYWIERQPPGPAPETMQHQF
ncbi:MAG: hypothetical protein HQL82_00325 [Magnetococcales bacterium]|nr:hypothetical protein [Magnetococcales bacterium]